MIVFPCFVLGVVLGVGLAYVGDPSWFKFWLERSLRGKK